MAQSVMTAVGKRISDEEVLPWCLSGGEPFEARAIAADELTVSLRQVGRRQPQIYSWDRISNETLLQLARESGLEVVEEADWLGKIRTVWDDNERVLQVAQSTSSIQPEVGWTAQRLRKKEIEIWLAQGEQASRDGDVEIQRRVAVDVARWITAEERPVFEDRLIRWWSASVDQSGPVALGFFPEAQVSDWNPRLRSLQLEWQANSQGLPGWKSRTGSSISGRGELARVQGRIYLDSELRFVETLEVRVVGVTTREDAPNFNVVLWDGSPDSLIFGAGIRPPEISSIRVGDEDVLLPAHMIVEEKTLFEGGGEILMPSPRPRVVPGKPALLVVREDAAGSSLRFDGMMVLEALARSVELRGGVALETFGVPVVVREVVVRGQISPDDWSRCLEKSARLALWAPK